MKRYFVDDSAKSIGARVANKISIKCFSGQYMGVTIWCVDEECNLMTNRLSVLFSSSTIRNSTLQSQYTISLHDEDAAA